MNIKSLLKSCAVLACGISLAACSGGVEDITLPQSATSVTISGVAAKGPIRNGTVMVHEPSASGEPGTLLATDTTDGQGRYVATLGSYSGPLVLVASGGYTDEATGQARSIDPAAPLHAALPCSCALPLLGAVTPLTELAYQKGITAIAGGADVATAFGDSTSQVSTLFSIDIAATQPVPPTPSDLQAAGNDQRNYTLTLAAISQMVKESGGSVAGVVAALNSAGNNAPAQVARALESFLNSNPDNQTGYRMRTLSLALTGVAATHVSALDVTLELPAGAAILADADGAVSRTSLSLTGEAASAYSATHYLAVTTGAPAKLRLSIATFNPLANGQFATLRCPVPTGAGAFVVSNTVARDENGVRIPGAGVTVQ